MRVRGPLLVLVLSPTLLAADTLVKLETATAIQLCPSCTEVRLPLVPDEKSTINLNEGPEVEKTYLNGSTSKNAAKFSARWMGKRFPREISVIVDPIETREAGTYDLYLNLQPDSKPGASRLKVQLTRPAATIEAIPKLIIDRTYWFIAKISDTHPKLLITETSKKSSLSISSVRPLSSASVGTEPIGGQLNIVLPQADIGDGKQSKLEYSLDGDFPLGTATGTMKIDAPQLANPVSFDFEVRSRIHWIYIGITIAVGLVVSYWVKVRLQQKIEFDQAHLDAQKLVERIRRETERHADPGFVAAYRPQFERLDEAMNSDSAADINAAKVALDTAWQAALQAFARRHQDQLDALDKLRDVTNSDWPVPPPVFDEILRARTAQTEVVQLIDADDLARADARRRQIVADLGNDIRTAALRWQTDEQQIVTRFQVATQGISMAVASALAKPATDLLASLHKVDATTPLATVEQIQQTLNDLRFERTSVEQFFQWLSTAIQMERATAEAAIPDPVPAVWHAEIFSVVSTTVAKFCTFLRTMVDQPSPEEVPLELAALHQAWIEGLQGQFPAANALVQAQLDARDYVQATKVALRERTGVAAAVVAMAAAAGPVYTPPEFHPEVVGAFGLPVYAIRTRFQTIATPEPVTATSVTDRARLKRDKMTQSLVLGVLLVVAGYGLQLKTFVGTFTDFSTLFFWAFGLDLTLDQLGKIAKKGS